MFRYLDILRGGVNILNENTAFYKALKEQNTNISQLSKKTHISRTTLTDIAKSRKRNITINKAKKICSCLNCSVVDIFPEIMHNE